VSVDARLDAPPGLAARALARFATSVLPLAGGRPDPAELRRVLVVRPDDRVGNALLTVPLALPEVEPVVPVVPAAPVAGVEPAVCSRLPRSSASTRRSGCKQAMSFWFLLLSGPMRLHWSPVTGSLSPLPATCRRLLSTPLDFR